jgi:hypothetical protein
VKKLNKPERFSRGGSHKEEGKGTFQQWTDSRTQIYTSGPIAPKQLSGCYHNIQTHKVSFSQKTRESLDSKKVMLNS